MLQDYIFVSCDIVSHSAESSFDRQRENVSAINRIVGDLLQNQDAREVIWASGGDGGHVALPPQVPIRFALSFIESLREWSAQAGVKLRITANCGTAEAIRGADGRIQLVGPGINLAGRLLPFGSGSRVVVTERFVEIAKAEFGERFATNEPRNLQPKNLPDEKVFLLSLRDRFDSTWDTPVTQSDGVLLNEAFKRSEALEVIYRAKRLLEINPEDAFTKEAMQTLALQRIRPKKDQGFLIDLLLDEQFGWEIVRASGLVERRVGDAICEFGDEGTTMFLILKGQIGVFFPKPAELAKGALPPPDLIMYPGELAGELAFALKRPRTATLRCLEDTALLAFSKEMFERIQRERVGMQLKEALDRKLLARIVEHVWNNAAFFRGGPQSDRSEILGKLKSPWLTLLPHSQTVPTRRGKLLIPDESFEGLSIVVSGRIEQEGDLEILNGKDFPILSAEFPDEFVRPRRKYQTLDDITVVKIHRDGFLEFGSEAYREILKRMKRTVNSGSKAANGEYDVFLSHNRKDIVFVRVLEKMLTSRGLRVWFDESELVPGQRCQETLESALVKAKSVAVLVSENGLGQWEIREVRAALLNRERRIIPVFLPDCPGLVNLPLFLQDYSWVDLRMGISDEGIDHLVWGITGNKPPS